MTPTEILSYAPRVLSQAQRQAYFDTGYLLLPELIDKAWLEKIRAVAAEFVEQSRACVKSDEQFDLEPGHTSAAPKLRRLSFPVDHHEVFREFAFNSVLVDVAEDLLGPMSVITIPS